MAIEKAYDLLMHLKEHAPQQYRNSALRDVRPHREVVDAYESERE